MIGSDAIWKLATLALIFFAVLTAESLWPLRNKTENKLKRVIQNLSIGAVSAFLARLFFLPFVIAVATFATRHEIGLMNVLNLSGVSRLLLSLVLLDYTIYIWHRLNHQVPFLWRFHSAHHSDLDLDASTTLRFHFGELGLSAVYRSLQVLLLGIDVPTLLVFEIGVTAFALFHHANLRLPAPFDGTLAKAIVTPRMHGIHHSIVRNETDANYGVILTAWDRIHGSLKLKVSQESITIGLPSHRSIGELGVKDVLLIPFRKQRSWRLPSGEIPARDESVQPMQPMKRGQR